MVDLWIDTNDLKLLALFVVTVFFGWGWLESESDNAHLLIASASVATGWDRCIVGANRELDNLEDLYRVFLEAPAPYPERVARAEVAR